MVGAQLPIEAVNWLTRSWSPVVKSAGIVIAQVITCIFLEIKQADLYKINSNDDTKRTIFLL